MVLSGEIRKETWRKLWNEDIVYPIELLNYLNLIVTLKNEDINAYGTKSRASLISSVDKEIHQ